MPDRVASPAPHPNETTAPDARTRRFLRMAGGLLLFLLAVWMLRFYLTSIGWAVVIAISVWPLYRRLQAALAGSRVAAPLIVTGALALVLIVPLALVIGEIGREGQVVMEWLARVQQNGIPVPAWLQHLPFLSQQLDAWWQAHLAQPQSAKQFLEGLGGQNLTEWSKSLGGALLSHVLHAFLTFLSLFMLLRNGERIGNRVLTTIDRWFGSPGERLAETMAKAVRGTVNGTILVAVGEGVVIGIGFFIAGVPNAALFAILTTAFAMLPLGAWFAFGTAAIVLVLSGGSIAAAAAVFAWGAVIMLVGDNVVQPALIGSAVRLPFLWTLLGILGGLETFGLIGLFVGPVVMAALLTIWQQQSQAASDDRPAGSITIR